jgi:hypothetical protein
MGTIQKDLSGPVELQASRSTENISKQSRLSEGTAMEKVTARNATCDGQHRFFALEPVGLEAEGAVLIIMVCTACGEVRQEKLVVAQPGSVIQN